MPKDPPLVNPKDEMLLELYEEEGAILEQPSTQELISFHIVLALYVCCSKSNTILVGQT